MEVILGIYASSPKVISYKFCHHLSLFRRKLLFSHFMKIFRESVCICTFLQQSKNVRECMKTRGQIFFFKQIHLIQRLLYFIECFLLLVVSTGWEIEALGHSHSQWGLKIKGGI